MTAPRNTSLVLILFTFITGLAFGWMLYDFFGPQPSQGVVQSTSLPASGIAQQPTQLPTTSSTAVQPSATSLPPTATPVLPTATLLPPTATAVPPSATVLPPTSTAAPPSASATPIPATVTATATLVATRENLSYVAHKVAPGETLADIARQGGSDAGLIASYNRLSSEPQAGRLLIVPGLDSKQSSLANEPLQLVRGNSEQPRIALTLDAGASAAPTPQMLDALRERGLHITFFLTGKWIRENPALVRQIIADGHEIGNHTLNHPDLRKLNAQQIADELAETELALHEVADTASIRPFFRAPYGAYNDRVLQTVQSQGYLSIYWTLDSLDSVGEPKSPEFLLERVTRKLSPEQLRGAIILAHCGSQPTADALPAILDRYAEMGFEVTTVSRVMEP